MPAGFGPREPVPGIWPSSSRPVTSSSGHESPSAQTIGRRARDSAVLDLEALGCDLEQLPPRVGRGGAHRRAHRGSVDEPAETTRTGPARCRRAAR